MIFGESVVGYFSDASSGTYFSTGSSSESLPSSRSSRTDIAVKLLVIEAIRKTVSAFGADFVSRSRYPAAPACTNLPSMTMPHAAPGTWLVEAKS